MFFEKVVLVGGRRGEEGGLLGIKVGEQIFQGFCVFGDFVHGEGDELREEGGGGRGRGKEKKKKKGREKRKG